MMQLRMTQAIHKEVRSDLRRSHPFAYERVGYVFVRPAGGTVLAVTGYEPVSFILKIRRSELVSIIVVLHWP